MAERRVWHPTLSSIKESVKNLPLLVLSSRLRAATEGDPADAQVSVVR